MAGAGFQSAFDVLPAEVLDIITAKVRGSCWKSFKSLEGTSTWLRDSARRCTSRTLVVEPLEQLEKGTVRKPGQHHGRRLTKHLNRVLLEEITKRPGLSELVMSEPSFLSRSGSFSILATLSSVSWTKCTLVDYKRLYPQRGGSEELITWDGSFCKRVLSGSKRSLEELRLNSFQFQGPALVKLGQLYPNLAVLELEGSIHEPCQLPGHHKLSKLDVADLGCFGARPLRLRNRQAASRSHLFFLRSDPAIFEGIWPPNICYLTVMAFCDWTSDPHGDKIFEIVNPLKGLSSLPYTLETLELQLWGGSASSRRSPLCPILAASDCPLLREIHVRLSSGTLQARLNPESIRQLFGSESERIFEACPQLEELCFSGCDGETIVRCLPAGWF